MFASAGTVTREGKASPMADLATGLDTNANVEKRRMGVGHAAKFERRAVGVPLRLGRDFAHSDGSRRGHFPHILASPGEDRSG